MTERFNVAVVAEDNPWVLGRIALIFTRKRVTIENLTMSRESDHTRYHLTVTAERAEMQILLRRIENIVEVRRARCEQASSMLREQLPFMAAHAAVESRQTN